MRRLARRMLPGLLTLLLAGSGCDAVLSGFSPDRLRIRELRPADVEQALREGRDRIVQVRDVDDHLPGIQGALRMTVDAPLPEGIQDSEHGWIVVAQDREEGLLLAARLARAGASQVAFTVGEKSELIALAGIRTAARDSASEEPSKPTPKERHPSP